MLKELTTILVLSAALANPQLGVINEVLSAETALYAECSFCSASADCVRETCETDIAVLPGELFNINLQTGPISREELAGYYNSNPSICILALTAQELYDALENSVSHETQREDESLDAVGSAFGGYLHVSGIRYTWDASAPVGERITAIYNENGTLLEPDDSGTLTLALPETLLQGEYGYQFDGGSAQNTGQTLLDCVAAHITRYNGLDAPEDERETVLAANQNRIVDRFPVVLLCGLIALALLFNAARFRNVRNNSQR